MPQENILEYTTESVKSNLTSDKFTSGKRNDKKFPFPSTQTEKNTTLSLVRRKAFYPRINTTLLIKMANSL